MRSLFSMTLIVAALALPASAAGATPSGAKSAPAVRFPFPPVIDGDVSDEAWRLAPPVEGLIQFEPHNGRLSDLRTVARFGFDDEALYVAFACYDPDPDGIAAAMTRRDSDLREDDCVAVFLDTLDDDHTATAFVTNLLGTQWDFRITDNGRSTDSNWDATWYSAASRTQGGWTAELAIPFRILKFRNGTNQTWGINFGRSYPRNLEISYWAGPMVDELRVSQFGDLTGMDPPVRTKRYEFLPYALSQVERGAAPTGKTGMDLSYRLTNTLGADFTVNPDFATIEADAEEINLTRFERWIDEKRPFFLEGGEMFKQRVRQFYSRRIGDIPWGLKLVGNLRGWDIAVMSAQSDPAETAGDSAAVGSDATYSVVRLKRGIFGSSNVGLLMANRDWRGENQGSAGLDATLFLSKVLGVTAQLVRAHGPRHNGALTWFLRPALDTSNSHFHVRYSSWDVGLMENINAVGFIRDDDRREIDTNLSHTFWPKGRSVEKIRTGVNYNRYWSQAGVHRSSELDAWLDIELASKWALELSHEDEFKLYEKKFDNRETQVELSYDTRAGRRAEVSYSFGRSFDSDLDVFGGGVEFKITDAWSMDYELTRLRLDPDPEDETTWIHSLRTNYYFTTDLYFKLFFQTNTAIEKKNTQAALVWRFLPPFGSVQLAYQRGTSRAGTRSDQGHTLFTKFSWVL